MARFVIKGGKKSNEDTASVFLLGKELAYDTARGQVDRLANALGKMTKSEAKKWGTAVEGATGGGEALSRKVCGATGTGSTNNCGTNTTGGQQNTTISTAFTAADSTLLSTVSAAFGTDGAGGYLLNECQHQYVRDGDPCVVRAGECETNVDCASLGAE